MPQCHRVAVHEERLRLGGAHGRHSLAGEPARDGELVPRPLQEFGVAAHLDHEVTEREHGVLTERQQLGLLPAVPLPAGEPRRSEHLPRLRLVHHLPPADHMVRAQSRTRFTCAYAPVGAVTDNVVRSGLTRHGSLSTMTGAARAFRLDHAEAAWPRS